MMFNTIHGCYDSEWLCKINEFSFKHFLAMTGREECNFHRNNGWECRLKMHPPLRLIIQGQAHKMQTCQG
jgi:hypothetical protein